MKLSWIKLNLATLLLAVSLPSSAFAISLGTLTQDQCYRVHGVVSLGAFGEGWYDAGDFNGDGYSDVAVSGHRMGRPDAPEAGSVFILFGSPQKPAPISIEAINGINGIRIDGAAGEQWFGRKTALGDINGDGYDDLLAGADIGTTVGQTGSAYVVFGRQDWSTSPTVNVSVLNGINGFKLDVGGNGGAGSWVAIVDLNNDGYKDMAINNGAADPNGIENAGCLYVVFGKSNWSETPTFDLAGLNGVNGFRFEGSTANDRVGIPSAAGDVNGDSIEDLAVLTTGASKGYVGSSYIIFGKETWSSSSLINSSYFNGTNGILIDGTRDAFQSTIRGGTDFNNDGIDDIVIGSGHYNDEAGAAFIIWGKANWSQSATLTLGTLAAGSHLRLDGAQAGDYTSSGVGLGDVNGDGINDMLIAAGSADYNGFWSGSSYLIYGNPTWSSKPTFNLSGLTPGTGMRFDGENTHSRASYVSSAGDFNGDGFADFLIGSPGADTPPLYSRGAVYVVYGAPQNAGFADSGWELY